MGEKWEYKVVFLPLPDAEKLLNSLGKEGWELITVVTMGVRQDWVGFLKRKLIA